MKLTTKDYVDAGSDLAKAGFKSIQELARAKGEGSSVTDIATRYGIEEKVVELVQTTNSYEQFSQIVELELEKERLEQEVETVKTENQAPQRPHKAYYVASVIILLAIAGAVIWGIVAFIGWLGSL